MSQTSDNESNRIRQFELTNLEDFPVVAFMSISFTHHILTKSNQKRSKSYNDMIEDSQINNKKRCTTQNSSFPVVHLLLFISHRAEAL